MRTALTILCTLFFLSGYSQGTTTGPQYVSKRWMQTSATGYGSWQGVSCDNMPVGGVEYIPSGTPPGGGWPVTIFLTGVGEKGGYNTGFGNLLRRCDTLQLSGGAYNDASVDAIFATTPFSQLKNPSGRLVGKKYAIKGRTDSTEMAWIGVQCWGDDQTASAWGWYEWPPMYVLEVIKRIKTRYSGILDSTKIILTGLSYGGGGSGYMGQDSAVSSQLSCAYWFCMGYEKSTYNYQYNSRSGLPERLFHANNDGTAPVTRSKNYVDRWLNLSTPPNRAPELYIFVNGGHNIWDRLYDPINWDTDYELTNGDIWNSNARENCVAWSLRWRNADNGYSRRPDLKP